MTKLKYIAFLAVFFTALFASAQPASDEQLAQFYLQKGDFENAKSYYEKLYQKSKTKFYYTKLLNCYEQLNDLKSSEKLAQKQGKRYPDDFTYQLDLGKIYEKTDRPEKAQAIYENIIKEVPVVVGRIRELSTEFKNFGKYNLALKTLEKGRKQLGKQYDFNFQFADIYAIQGETEKMLDEYFSLLKKNPNYRKTIEILLSRQFKLEEDNEENEKLRIKILEAIRKNPSNTDFDELLIWFFIQKKDFNGAFIQAKALDKKSDKNGRSVFNLGNIAMKNQAFSVAKKSFTYVVDYGPDNVLHTRAQNKLLEVGYEQLVTERNVSQEKIDETVQSFENGINRMGKNKRAIPSIKKYAEILAFYAGKPNRAKTILEEALEFPGLRLLEKSELKILLADVYIVLNEIWDASVLYLQVEHDFKHDKLGHLAKFKNAKVYYYDGDFKWAQAQLDVLKASTSKLIANDALKLSLLITDNLGLDSTLAPMQLYAKADLLIQQRKYTEAFQMLDSISGINPFHTLGDEILLKKAQAYEQQGNWDKAITNYSQIYASHGDDILADDALFRMAKIYENHLKDKEKAKEYYRKILFEYKGSLYTIESRKKFQEIL